MINSYKDLLAWQKAILLVKETYILCNTFPKEEKYGLSSQLKRAAISIPSNIAEGSSKQSTKEFIRFLNIAYGSLMETETQIIIANNLNFINQKQYSQITLLTTEVGKIINGLRNSLLKK